MNLKSADKFKCSYVKWIEDLIKDLRETENAEPRNAFLKPKDLKDFLHSLLFFVKTQAAVNITHGEIFHMVLEYSLKNSLSKDAIVMLMQLINEIFDTQVLPESAYYLDKIINHRAGLSFHAVCHQCCDYLGEFGMMNPVTRCPTCKIILKTETPSNKSFFMLIDPSEQIADLIKIHEKFFDYLKMNRHCENGIIRDVYDGKEYRLFMRSVPDEDYYNTITAIFNTDGAPKFKSNKVGIWPLFITINELPIQERLNHPVVCGLWFHKGKPDMSVLLDKFVTLINDVNQKGISCTLKDEEVKLKLYIQSCCVDSVARAPVQGIKQFNGNYGCSWCLHPGVWQGSMRFPVLIEAPRRRDVDETLEIMQRITVSTNPRIDLSEFGIMHPCALMNLPSFNVIKGFGPDYLHFALHGVCEDCVQYYVNVITLKDQEKIDRILENLAVPQQIGRRSGLFTSKNDWKAKEWENFLLYYSVPVFSIFLPDLYFKHWLLFAKSMYILLQDIISIEELNEANVMLHEFVNTTQRLFGIEAMTYNIHQCQHICEYVLNWGPIWANSTFSFESANHQILKAIKSARGATLQVARYIKMNHTSLVMKDFMAKQGKHESSWFIQEVLSGHVQQVFQISDTITYFGKGLVEHDHFELVEKFNLNADTTKFFKKMVKDKCLYESNRIIKERSNNSFAICTDEEFIQIECFIVTEEKKEVTACRIVNVTNFHDFNKLKLIDNIDPRILLIRTKNIRKVCVKMDVKDHEEKRYLIPVPHLVHY